MTKEQRLSVRIPVGKKELKKRLREVSKSTGVHESELIIAAATAICDYVEKHGKITFPIKITEDDHKGLPKKSYLTS